MAKEITCENCPGRNGCPCPERKNGETCGEYEVWAKLTLTEALILQLTDVTIEKQRYKEVLEIIAGERPVQISATSNEASLWVTLAKQILYPEPPKPVDKELPF